jgi:hypothetical protein
MNLSPSTLIAISATSVALHLLQSLAQKTEQKFQLQKSFNSLVNKYNPLTTITEDQKNKFLEIQQEINKWKSQQFKIKSLIEKSKEIKKENEALKKQLGIKNACSEKEHTSDQTTTLDEETNAILLDNNSTLISEKSYRENTTTSSTLSETNDNSPLNTTSTDEESST